MQLKVNTMIYTFGDVCSKYIFPLKLQTPLNVQISAVWVSTSIHGHDERCRLMRRTIVRYLNLTFVMAMRLMCLPVKKRFPTLDHLIEAGILTDEEKKVGVIRDIRMSLSGNRYIEKDIHII